MEDHEIIKLYWDRDNRAISATSAKYGGYCQSIAINILGNREDAEECVNDMYLRAWNAMPDCWPKLLAAFLGKITRNLSFNRYRNSRAEKRGGGEMPLILDELADCVSDRDDVENTVDRRELAEAIDAFVRGLSEEKQALFIRRYWYADPVFQIARDYGLSPENVSKTLERTRKKLRACLEERGFSI